MSISSVQLLVVRETRENGRNKGETRDAGYQVLPVYLVLFLTGNDVAWSLLHLSLFGQRMLKVMLGNIVFADS